MSIALKPWAVALLIATFAVLLGFAVGQVTSAQSEKATVSARPLIVKDPTISNQLRSLTREVEAINDSMGGSSIQGTVRESLEKIVKNTYWVCEGVRSAVYCDQ